MTELDINHVVMNKIRVNYTSGEDGEYFFEVGTQHNDGYKSVILLKTPEDVPDGYELDISTLNVDANGFNFTSMFGNFGSKIKYIIFDSTESDGGFRGGDGRGYTALDVSNLSPLSTDTDFELVQDGSSVKLKSQAFVMPLTDDEDNRIELHGEIRYYPQTEFGSFGSISADITLFTNAVKSEQGEEVSLGSRPHETVFDQVSGQSMALYLLTEKDIQMPLEQIGYIEARENLEVTVFDGVPRIIGGFVDSTIFSGRGGFVGTIRVLRSVTFGGRNTFGRSYLNLGLTIYQLGGSVFGNGPRVQMWKGQVRSILVRRVEPRIT